MSNHGGGRAYYDQKVRYRPPNQNPKLSLPPRPPKPYQQANKTPTLGPDISTLMKRFGAPSSRVESTPLKGDKTPQELPIYQRRADIKAMALQHTKGIIVAKTGSGKTTLVPQFLQEVGFNVTVVSPRRLAASEVARFGAQLRDEELGQSIGFKHALDKSVSSKTQITYATEGYELARQLHNPLTQDHVLIFDEFHERTAYATLLLGFYKMREAKGLPIPRILIMSATLGVKKLTDYLGPIPAISVEGRQFTVKELPAGPSPAADVLRFLNEGINPLSFHYGKKDIEELITEVQQKAPPGAKIYPLHSKLTREEQQRALAPRPKKAVAATNTAQTSLTVDCDAVVITGKVRRLVLNDAGVPSLIIDDISQDELIQQWGRTGRLGPGVFVSHAKPFQELEPHAPPEIQNMPLETVILRLAAAGISFDELNRYLIDRPSPRHIEFGYKTLQDLGLLGSLGITPTGREVAKLPVDARMGKLLVRAAAYQREHGVQILDDAIRIAAVVEAEGILSGDNDQWRGLASGRQKSDLIKQSVVYHRALGLSEEQLATFGIEEANLRKARQTELMIRRRMELSDEAPPFPENPGDETPQEKSARKAALEYRYLWLSRAIIEAHTDSVFRLVQRDGGDNYLYKPLYDKPDAKDQLAVLQKESVVGGAKIVVGTRFNIGFLDDSGYQREQALLLNTHCVDDLDWLELKTPPHLQHELKEGISSAHRPAQKKQKGMVARDFRGGKSFRNGRNNFGKGFS